jgi:hypothetical protein
MSIRALIATKANQNLNYLLPLDHKIAERIKLLAQTYPKERATSETSDTPGVHPGEGRAARTVAL